SLAVLDPVLPDSIFTILPIALIPLSITVAMLRYQLFDLRLVLSRSVVYVVLTAAVIGVYAGIVALGGVLLPARVGLGAALIATLLIAVAFHPVRVWLQRAVDRAIYGARRDPVRAAAAVGGRLSPLGGGCGGRRRDRLGRRTPRKPTRDTASPGRGDPRGARHWAAYRRDPIVR